MDISSIRTKDGRVWVNHLALTIAKRKPVAQFELALQPMRFAPKRFRPIRTSPFQIQAAHAAITHDEGMGFATLIDRRFTPRQRMNAAHDDGRFPFYADGSAP
jgi:hypothetical protein